MNASSRTVFNTRLWFARLFSFCCIGATLFCSGCCAGQFNSREIEETITCSPSVRTENGHAIMTVTVQNLRDEWAVLYVGSKEGPAFMIDLLENGKPVRRTPEGRRINQGMEEAFEISDRFSDIDLLFPTHVPAYGKASREIDLSKLFFLEPKTKYTAIVRHSIAVEHCNVFYGACVQFTTGN